MMMQFPWWGYVLSVALVIPAFCLVVSKRNKLTRAENKNLLLDMLLLSGILYLCIGAMAFWCSELVIVLVLYIPALPAIYFFLDFKARREHVLNERIRIAAMDVGAQVQESNAAINEIAATMESFLANFRRINEDVGSLSVLITTVKKVAKQLFNLSLNANLEAARAGDHGRGFNVVAEEFGKLSNEIQGSLKGSFLNADGIIKTINGLAGDLESNASATEQLSQAFEVIATSMERLSALTERGGDR